MTHVLIHTGQGRLTVSTQAQPTKKENDNNSAARQMMGMKGAGLETDKNKIRVQLMKPVTWIPLIWGECENQASLQQVEVEYGFA